MRLFAVTIFAVFAMLAGGNGVRAESIWTIEFSRAFGARNVEKHGLAAFGKWQSALQRAQDEDTQARANCRATPLDPVCHARRMRADFLRSQRGLSVLEQLAAVQTYVNRVRWVDDASNYGVSDYWATPDEFFARGGDCEDYAFAKYDALKRLGVPADQMRILVLNDLKMREPHAVLLVQVDGQIWSLDNNLRAIAPVQQMTHYDPIYSINETGWWLHRGEVRDVDSAGRRR